MWKKWGKEKTSCALDRGGKKKKKKVETITPERAPEMVKRSNEKEVRGPERRGGVSSTGGKRERMSGPHMESIGRAQKG